MGFSLPRLRSHLARKLSRKNTKNQVHDEKGADDDESDKKKPIDIWLAVGGVGLQGKGKVADEKEGAKHHRRGGWAWVAGATYGVQHVGPAFQGDALKHRENGKTCCTASAGVSTSPAASLALFVCRSWWLRHYKGQNPVSQQAAYQRC